MNKILILEANPHVDLDLNKEIDDLQNVIQESRKHEEFEICIKLEVESTKLEQIIKKEKPNIIHFCGHGAGQDGLVFRDRKIDADRLSHLFESCQHYLQCVVLNACYSEIQANEIVKYIPYVIGINKNETIGDRAAIAFSIGFYSALGYGRSFQYAYRSGCKAIELASSDDSLNRNAIAEKIRELIPINVSSENSTTQEHLKPVFKKKSIIQKEKSEMLEKHYNSLIEAIQRGWMIPFLGSDINLCDRPIEGNGELESWKPDSPYPPSGKELAIYLAEKFPPPPPVPVKEMTCPLCGKETEIKTGKVPKECPLTLPVTLPANTKLVCPQSSESLTIKGLTLQYLSQYAYLSDKGKLYDKLKLLKLGSQSNQLHNFFATLPSIMREKGYYQDKRVEYPLIVTSNYDCALERAFEEAEEPFDLVFYSNALDAEKEDRFVHRTPDGRFHQIDNPNEYEGLLLKERTVILKLYGSVDQIEEGKTLVITEENFIEYFVSREIADLLPQQLRKKIHFPSPNILFLGYTLGDWNQRIILHRIWRNLGFKQGGWWAIQPHPEQFAQELWNSYDVNLYNMPLRDYIIELEQRVRDISNKGGNGHE